MVYFLTSCGGWLQGTLLVGTADEIRGWLDRDGGRKTRTTRELGRELGGAAVRVRQAEGGEREAEAIRAGLSPWRSADDPIAFTGGGPDPEGWTSGFCDLLERVLLLSGDWTGGDALALGVRSPKPRRDRPARMSAGLGSRLGRGTF